METVTRSPKPPMFPHDVPDAEPPVGTVAAFYTSFANGGGMGGTMMLRTEDGWTADPRGRRDLLSWAQLTDLDTMNARILERDPRSTSRFTAVQVALIAAPLPQGAGA